LNQVLARAITKGSAEPVNDYLKMTNRKKVTIRDIDPKSISTQELYGFVNMATREWKVGSPKLVAVCSCLINNCQ
jgi:dynein heavy chain